MPETFNNPHFQYSFVVFMGYAPPNERDSAKGKKGKMTPARAAELKEERVSRLKRYWFQKKKEAPETEENDNDADLEDVDADHERDSKAYLEDVDVNHERTVTVEPPEGVEVRSVKGTQREAIGGMKGQLMQARTYEAFGRLLFEDAGMEDCEITLTLGQLRDFVEGLTDG